MWLCVTSSSFRGLDFRSSYRRVGEFASFTDCPILCVSATITKEIHADVVNLMALNDAVTVARKPDRWMLSFMDFSKTSGSETTFCKIIHRNEWALIENNFLVKIKPSWMNKWHFHHCLPAISANGYCRFTIHLSVCPEQRCRCNSFRISDIDIKIV